MPEIDQECSSLAGFERPTAQSRLALHHGVGYALATPFLVRARRDDHFFTVTLATAKEAYEQAVEWQVVGRLTDISINDGDKTFSISEFSLVMALAEIENTVGAEAKD
ncbi:hypothetical protein IVB22_01135 [Bradyrhizobium sp. 190]|uniref:hypothetical protein n=1 Tax=Bradyrhizobium sp. 190 TaxID=2782658 RepID=UPI001FF8BEED|nr:hypothetical protein [Bradyrhizobium sp. 190]MCK1511196.1 hypothetical protein [Bradyrhizobium sp. 190]